MAIKTGDMVKDRVTGFAGMAIARTEWLNGCARITVQPTKLTKEGNVATTETFDETQLELVSERGQSTTSRKTGGPIPTPRREPNPKR